MKSQTTALFKYGLNDLIAGKTPTLSGWTANPTDAADITDGDITTFCNTGNKVLGGGWQYAYIDYDLGSFYDVLVSFVGGINTTAGTVYVYTRFYDGTGWVNSYPHTYGSAVGTVLSGHTYGGRCSRVRLGITCTAACTITPNIREISVWRLK